MNMINWEATKADPCSNKKPVSKPSLFIRFLSISSFQNIPFKLEKCIRVYYPAIHESCYPCSFTRPVEHSWSKILVQYSLFSRS